MLRVNHACQQAGRSPDEITIVAASKTRTPAEVLAALAAGIVHCGENRPEEAQPKIEEVWTQAEALGLPSPRWHMIGHVQSRKAKLVVGRYHLVHSLDSLRLAQRLSRLAEEQGPEMECLVEINVGGEESKYGYPAPAEDGAFAPSFLRDLEGMLELPALRITGLMTMAPPVEHPDEARPYFRRLRLMRDRLREQFPHQDWRQLSMGMTDDFEAGILEGATILRIGRALFGPRSA
ncbi:MAG: YggS family pyridoxal phosphate-dependent enzyme [Anaerolineae bacterium]|nr:YggS family pyridoxal phosphate-dependent enzyme [Anaerolineae bacterium]